MLALRQALSGGALLGAALLGLIAVTSAPAASGPGATLRSFVVSAHEAGHHSLERADVLPHGLAHASPSLLRALRVANVGEADAYRIEHAVGGESVAAARASAWHTDGFTGEGVKVAIIDGGFNGLAERQAEGDVPANAVTQDHCGGKLTTASEHGTAVAEIAHEMAPEAQLYLVCIETATDFAAAVAYAKSQAVHIINFSAGWEGPFRNDGSDRFSAIVADARASGILWVNSAGNEGDTHWAGPYSPGGDNVHDWASSGDEGNTFVWPNGHVVCGFLRWDEWPNGISDFDLALVMSGSNTVLAMSADAQTGSQPPFEAICRGQASGSDLRVYWAILGYDVKTSPPLDLVSWSTPLEYSVPAGSVASPATSPAALAVGALCWQSRQLEAFSSQGPTIDGRVKPDLVAHDSVSGATYGPFTACPSGFAGTSASSPEVAGAAALVKQAFPDYGPDELKAYLMRATRDLGAPGVDSTYGAGELQLPDPPDLVRPTARALPSSGRRGRPVKLLSSVADDSGAVSLVVYVKRGTRTLATIRRNGLVRAAAPKVVATTWRAPATVSGTSFRHCVRATDQAGNASALSCATLALR